MKYLSLIALSLLIGSTSFAKVGKLGLVTHKTDTHPILGYISNAGCDSGEAYSSGCAGMGHNCCVKKDDKGKAIGRE